MDRRGFVKLCAGSAAMLVMGAQVAWATGFEDLPRTLLTDANGKAFKTAELGTHEAYVFHYPYKGVPCFLINLGKPAAEGMRLNAEGTGDYDWPGGVGPQRNLVAYVAICSHQMSAPNKTASYLRYAKSGSELAGGESRIVCCAHASVFDPAQGAKVLGGQATYPLVPVRLEYDAANDTLAATGVAGLHLIQQYFKAYKRDLIEQFGAGVYREAVGDTSALQLLSQYSSMVPEC